MPYNASKAHAGEHTGVPRVPYGSMHDAVAAASHPRPTAAKVYHVRYRVLHVRAPSMAYLPCSGLHNTQLP